MVYLNIPPELTDEEELLKEKYEQLRHLQNRLNAPKLEVSPQTSLKRTVKDAKEVAKKLLKSGAITAIKTGSKDTQGFKRPIGAERKHSSSKRRNISASDNQSFSTSYTSNHAISTTSSNSEFKSISNISNKPCSPTKNLYESFVNRGKLEDEIKEQHGHLNKKELDIKD